MRRQFTGSGRVVAGLLASCLFVGGSARADERVYRRAVPSTVLVFTPDGYGSGVVVDVIRRWVVTAAHVPGKHNVVAVAFPEFDRAGWPITEAAYYAKGGGAAGAVRGQVLDRRPARDLALIVLDALPPQARGIPLSGGGTREGQAVHVIGSSNLTSGAVFGCVSGQVRNVFTKPAKPNSPLAGRVVLTSVATNQGDSGGPVVDNAGELVAIVSEGTIGGEGRQVVDLCVDVSEVRALLDANRPAKPWEPRPQDRGGATSINPFLVPAIVSIWEQGSPPARLFPPFPESGPRR